MKTTTAFKTTVYLKTQKDIVALEGFGDSELAILITIRRPVSGDCLGDLCVGGAPVAGARVAEYSFRTEGYALIRPGLVALATSMLL
jgi:hypothetical protein